MNENGDQPQGVQVPAIELGNCQIAVIPHPQKPSIKCIMVGPIFLMIPLDEVGRRVVTKGLTGLVVAQPGDVKS